MVLQQSRLLIVCKIPFFSFHFYLFFLNLVTRRIHEASRPVNVSKLNDLSRTVDSL